MKQSQTTYKVKRDFDPVDNLNFRDESFEIIHEYFLQAIEEINGVNEIKARFVNDTAKQQFTCVITNRAKIGTTGYISIGIQQGDHFGRNGITYAMSERLVQNTFGNNFVISHNDYELFWIKYDMMSNTQNKPQLKPKEIAKTLWEEFIDQVGISC